MDSISITLTGRLGDDPVTGTAKGSGKPWARLSLAVDVLARRGGDRPYDTYWYTVWCYNELAEHAAASFVKGDLVTVRADYLTARAWIPNGPDREPRAQAEVRAYDVAASVRYETLITAKGERTADGGDAAAPQDSGDPWAGEAPAAEVPEVLAGLVR